MRNSVTASAAAERAVGIPGNDSICSAHFRWSSSVPTGSPSLRLIDQNGRTPTNTS